MALTIDLLSEDLAAAERMVHMLTCNPYLARLDGRDCLRSQMVEIRGLLRAAKELRHKNAPMEVSLAWDDAAG